MNALITALTALALWTLPAIVFADFTCAGVATNPPVIFKGFVCLLLNLMNPLVGLIIGLALVVFLWGIVKYMQAGDNEDKLAEGRNMMIYGIVGLFVMVSVWGLVFAVGKTFGLNP